MPLEVQYWTGMLNKLIVAFLFPLLPRKGAPVRTIWPSNYLSGQLVELAPFYDAKLGSS
jgi:hypothetical protein